jgi:glycosyltransferase involved in cell wall biosynthesis
MVGARLAGAAAVVATSRAFREADVVHANSTRSGVYAAIACRIGRKPLVVHVRDTVSPEVMGRLGHALYARFVLPSAARVIANSSATATSARPHARVAVDVIASPSGIRRESGRQASSGFNDTVTPTIGMVARIAHWKGQDLLIRAFASALRGSDWRLRLAGGTSFDASDYLAELKALVDEVGIAEQVVFVGHVDDVFAEIARYDICVQFSRWAEPLGQNVLQYLASGRATIAADEGGPREWIVDGVNGLLVTPRDVMALTEALRLLTNDTGLRTRLAAAGPETDGLEDDVTIAARHEEVFRAVAATRGARPATDTEEDTVSHRVTKGWTR